MVLSTELFSNSFFTGLTVTAAIGKLFTYFNHTQLKYCSMPDFAEHLQVRANRADPRFVDRENKGGDADRDELSMDNRKQKEKETTLK